MPGPVGSRRPTVDDPKEPSLASSGWASVEQLDGEETTGGDFIPLQGKLWWDCCGVGGTAPSSS